jgi:hypothetical protein
VADDASASGADLHCMATTGLTVQSEVRIAEVSFCPPDSGRLGETVWPVGRQLREQPWAVAMVQAEGDDEAIEQVGRVLDAMRVFVKAQVKSRTADFGLPGSMPGEAMDHIVVKPGVHRGGVRWMGQYIGFTFSTALHSAWRESIWGKFVEPALVEPCAEGDARALRGIELLARSWVEADPGIALFLAVAALEAWLTSGDVGGKKYEFARRVAFFMCSGPAVWPDYDYSCPALSKVAEKAKL